MKSLRPKGESNRKTTAISSETDEKAFAEIVAMIQSARQKALASANIALIDLYWQVGEIISSRINTDGWGKRTVESLAFYIQAKNPGVKGFSPQNLWRMRQFFETYRNYPKLSTLLRELPWSSNMHILSKAKLPEEHEFYLRMAMQHRWPVREVARQIDSALFERAVLNPPKLSTALREIHPGAETVFRDAYMVEFLELPEVYREADLHKSLLENLRRFLAELGHDFCFIWQRGTPSGRWQGFCAGYAVLPP